MIFSEKSREIKGIEKVEDIDENSRMVHYLMEDGSIDVSVVPKNNIKQEDLKCLFEYMKEPQKLLVVNNYYHKAPEQGPWNSFSCGEYVERLLNFLNLAYQYIELVRFNVYRSGDKDEGAIRALNQCDFFEKRCRQVLEANRKDMSPIWAHRSEKLNYTGVSPETVFYIYDFDDYKTQAKRKMEYCLATGVPSISGFHAYGAGGGVVSYLFITQLYGIKAADMFKKNSVECRETFETIDNIHRGGK